MTPLVLAALAAAALGAPPPGAAAPARMLVKADEWSLLSSRREIRAGRLELQLYNRDEDTHDLAARRVDRLGRWRGRTFRVRATRPGQLSAVTWKLPSGQYRLWCSLPGHRRAGMRARLQVRKRTAR